MKPIIWLLTMGVLIYSVFRVRRGDDPMETWPGIILTSMGATLLAIAVLMALLYFTLWAFAS